MTVFYISHVLSIVLATAVFAMVLAGCDEWGFVAVGLVLVALVNLRLTRPL